MQRANTALYGRRVNPINPYRAGDRTTSGKLPISATRNTPFSMCGATNFSLSSPHAGHTREHTIASARSQLYTLVAHDVVKTLVRSGHIAQSVAHLSWNSAWSSKLYLYACAAQQFLYMYMDIVALTTNCADPLSTSRRPCDY